MYKALTEYKDLSNDYIFIMSLCVIYFNILLLQRQNVISKSNFNPFLFLILSKYFEYVIVRVLDGFGHFGLYLPSLDKELETKK